jgi:polysaccharide export outer membrane protein
MKMSYGLNCLRFDLKKMYRRGSSAAAALLALATILSPGCASAPPPSSSVPSSVSLDVQTLNVGDVIKIAFPGTPGLEEAPQQIRRDGRINLSIIGEIKAADKTPAELEKELIEAYASELTSKEIKVTVLSSSFAVYVMGAVAKPGKITPERTLTALDAIMEAGGFDTARANMKAVRVIRQEGGQLNNYYLNMKEILEGGESEPFYLKAHDVVWVPEKISWF